MSPLLRRPDVVPSLFSQGLEAEPGPPAPPRAAAKLREALGACLRGLSAPARAVDPPTLGRLVPTESSLW